MAGEALTTWLLINFLEALFCHKVREQLSPPPKKNQQLENSLLPLPSLMSLAVFTYYIQFSLS